MEFQFFLAINLVTLSLRRTPYKLLLVYSYILRLCLSSVCYAEYSLMNTLSSSSIVYRLAKLNRLKCKVPPYILLRVAKSVGISSESTGLLRRKLFFGYFCELFPLFILLYCLVVFEDLLFSLTGISLTFQSFNPV